MTAAQLATLHALCFETPRPWSADEFTGFLNAGTTLFAGGSNGFALGRVIADEAELLTLAVHPAHRGQGSGRHWLLQYHQQARAAGATESFLEVARDNAAARALYHATGYIQTGTRPGYYRPPTGQAVDALVFSLKLA